MGALITVATAASHLNPRQPEELSSVAAGHCSSRRLSGAPRCQAGTGCGVKCSSTKHTLNIHEQAAQRLRLVPSVPFGPSLQTKVNED